MKKFILFSIIIVFSGILKAQTFPYLNASTGNRNQYIIDSDSNLIMFHQNQIEKLDNHFNPIWVKKYIGLDFYSLLLSKTGSIYFIAADTTNYTYFNLQYNRHIGKIDSEGNLEWEKTITHNTLSNINLRQLFLDRNNHLIISGEGTNTNGSGIILKLDTLGGPIYSKTIKNPNSFDFQNVTILNDSFRIL